MFKSIVKLDLSLTIQDDLKEIEEFKSIVKLDLSLTKFVRDK